MNFNTVRATVFSFESVGSTCEILENALIRYKHMITIQLRRVRRRIANSPLDNKWRIVPENIGQLNSLKVNLKSDCEKMPYLGMDESCKTGGNFITSL